jgi:hypothetical protein
MLKKSDLGFKTLKKPNVWHPDFWKINRDSRTFACMFIKGVQKHKAGTNENPIYFRLCESYRDSLGKTRQRMIRALGYMEELPRWSDKQELCRCLNDMVLRHQHAICDNPQIVELANYFYQKLLSAGKITRIRDDEASLLKEEERRKQEEITKDKLYRSALRLYGLHHELENWLSNRVRSLFGFEDKILLLDLTDTYFEGRMQGSSLAKYGRSKEKRSDCKLEVLAAVVNTEGIWFILKSSRATRATVLRCRKLLNP